jgi:hypothetical protein
MCRSREGCIRPTIHYLTRRASALAPKFRLFSPRSHSMHLPSTTSTKFHQHHLLTLHIGAVRAPYRNLFVVAITTCNTLQNSLRIGGNFAT